MFASAAGCAKLDANRHIYPHQSLNLDYLIRTAFTLFSEGFLKVCSSEIKCVLPVVLQHPDLNARA